MLVREAGMRWCSAVCVFSLGKKRVEKIRIEKNEKERKKKKDCM